LPHLLDDVFSGRMAGPLLTPEQRDAVGAWIESIPSLPPPSDLDPAAVARGRALFGDATVGCATCHGGERFTNNHTVDVGTGKAYQVPSLLGVTWREPLMHDGCAATSLERFMLPSCGGGDAHGVTSTLGAGALADLIAYLRSL
jgi:mono/diheme cytochrome c family protein